MAANCCRFCAGMQRLGWRRRLTDGRWIWVKLGRSGAVQGSADYERAVRQTGLPPCQGT